MHCPYCESGNIVTLRSLTSGMNCKKYTLHHCKNCFLQFFTPLEFEDIYSDDSLEAYREFHKGRVYLPERTKQIIGYMKNHYTTLSGMKVLDIGAGDGIQYKALKETFQIDPEQYYALELDSKSLESCRKRGIVNLITQYFNMDFAKSYPEKFDVIIISEVLEHQINPKDFLEAAFHLLKESGIILITVPNRERFFIKWRSLEGDVPPHHFLRFNKGFFKNITNSSLLACYDYSFKNKNIKESSIALSSLFLGNINFYFVFMPIALFLRLLDRLKGEGLLVALTHL